MRIRSGAALTAAAMATVVSTAAPGYAASATVHSTASPPYDISVTSTLDRDPRGAGVIHTRVAAKKLMPGVANPAAALPAGDLALRWGLYYIPNDGATWRLCKGSDSDPAYSFSPKATSTFSLDGLASILVQNFIIYPPPTRRPPWAECGDGIYGLMTDGRAFVNGGWRGVVNVYSGPEFLEGSIYTPGPVAQSQITAGKAAATAAQEHKGDPGAAARRATQLNANRQFGDLAAAKARTAATPPPPLPAAALPQRAR